jgi:hypothetical protein
VLTSTLTPRVIAFQADPPAVSSGQTASSSPPVGLCEVPPAPTGLHQPVLIASLGIPPAQPSRNTSIINEACLENIAGFERAYTVTFFAAMLAVALGLFLPGWPGKWMGRK